jgi:hypothetical protein
MVIVAVCTCRNHDKDPNIEINFADGKIYYICPECKKEQIIKLQAENRPYPKTQRL